MTEPVPLTYRAASLSLVIEAVLVIAVPIVAIMATRLPADFIAARLTPGTVIIALLWISGVWVSSRASKCLQWHDSRGDAPDTQESPKGHSQGAKDDASANKTNGTTHVTLVFVGVATLIAGVALERSGEAIASSFGLSDVFFGATVLAAATALPELSTGITSVRMKDYQLAISDIFGGNAFLPALFLLAVLISARRCYRMRRRATSTSPGSGLR